MRVAISGATGLVGRQLCAALTARGDEVVVLTRDPSREHGLPAVATRAFPPGEGAEVPVELFDDVEACVHLAGEPVKGRWTAAKKQAIRDSRLLGTRALVEAIGAARARGAGPRVLVSASAIGWYGERGDELLSEGEPPGEDFLAEVCQGWEAAALRAEAHGLRVACLRFGLVLAREGGALAEMKLPFSLGLGGTLGSGKQWWSWIHIDDLIGLILAALDGSAWEGPINACAPAPVRQASFAQALGRALHRPAWLPAPKFALRLVLGEFSCELLTSKRVVPAFAEAQGFCFSYSELEPALADLL